MDGHVARRAKPTFNRARSPMAASSDDGQLAAPIIFQCGNCHRVISDSNQLLATVPELGLLVLDAVVGVKALSLEEGDGGGTFEPLHCSACNHRVGRLYRTPPEPALASLVHTTEEPRYSLIQNALASYVLGSAAAHSPAATAGALTSDAASAGADDANGTLALGTGSRLDALESSEASAQQQLTQLMRVVLALDTRLRQLEDANGGSEPENSAGAKRPR
jgi:hypothetical protein